MSKSLLRNIATHCDVCYKLKNGYSPRRWVLFMATASCSTEVCLCPLKFYGVENIFFSSRPVQCCKIYCFTPIALVLLASRRHYDQRGSLWDLRIHMLPQGTLHETEFQNLLPANYIFSWEKTATLVTNLDSGS